MVVEVPYVITGDNRLALLMNIGVGLVDDVLYGAVGVLVVAVGVVEGPGVGGIVAGIGVGGPAQIQVGRQISPFTPVAVPVAVWGLPS